MIELTKIVTDSTQIAERKVDGVLSLPITSRIKSRLKVSLEDGRDAGVFLPRGNILRGGQLLQSECGLLIEVTAAAETVSSVYCEDALLLNRVTYHLGNRHVPLQIADGWVRYQHDHVLDDMVVGLGAKVTVEQAEFEPEDGAYGGRSGGHHHHEHEHDHSH